MPFLKKLLIILPISAVVIIGGILVTNSLTAAQPLPKDEMHAQLAEMYDGNVENLTLKGNTYEATVIKNGTEYVVKANAESGEVLSLTQTKETSPTQTSKKPEEKSNEHPEKSANDKENIENKEAVEDPKQDKDDSKDKDSRISKKDKEEEKEKKEESNREKKDSKGKKDKKDKEDKEKKEEPTTLISKEEAIQIALNELPDGLTGEVDDVDFETSSERSYYLVEIEIDTDDEVDEVIYEIDAITGEVLSVEWDD